MRQLPCAGDTENDELDDGPADDAGICSFGLVAELGFAFLYRCQLIVISHRPEMSYPLEDLFPPDVLQPRVQVLDPLRERLDLVLVGALDLARLANSHVQRELDGAVYACA
jgi:hypothetical protein